MVENKGTYLTREGLKRLENELHELKNVRRREIAERINQAKELGDLSENAEYSEAKTEQSFVEGRILELDNIIRNVVVIDASKRNSEIADIGSTLTGQSQGKSFTFTIVGSNEVDPAHGRISNESPIGKAFLGHRAGDTISIATPAGITEYTIEQVS